MRIEDKEERDFYEKEAIYSGWNVSTLKRQYHSCLYERLALSRNKDDVLRLANEGAIPQKPEDILHTDQTLNSFLTAYPVFLHGPKGFPFIIKELDVFHKSACKTSRSFQGL